MPLGSLNKKFSDVSTRDVSKILEYIIKVSTYYLKINTKTSIFPANFERLQLTKISSFSQILSLSH